MTQFLAIDGEAITTGDEHRYVLLAASDGEHLWRESGLGTTECLRWILDRKQAHEGAAMVAFGLNYDVNMILGDVGRDALKRLWAEGTVYWRGYRIDWIPGKLFGVHDGERYAMVADTFGFFQSSFVAALAEWDIEANEEVEEMKGLRGQFSAAQRARIVNYCIAECNLLEILMGRVAAALDTVGLRPRSWIGAGAIAAAMLSAQGVKHSHVYDHVAADPARGLARDDAARVAIACAYYGGRNELHLAGEHERLYVADLNSAYPAAAVELHGLKGARLRPRKRFAPTRPGIWRVRWRVASELPGPFPVREKRGIYWPSAGQGYYHAVEVAAALECYPGAVDVLDGFVLDAPERTRPFHWIPGVYRQRAALKASGDPAQRVLKLGLNSIYGKLAQGPTKRGNPPFQSYFWAGQITATTRAAMLRVAAQVRPAMIATDGIFTTEPAPLPTGPGLGEWSLAEYGDAFLAQAGLYDADDDGRHVRRSRGFFTREIDFADLRAGWRAEGFEYVGHYPTRRFIGIGTALVRKDPSVWRRWLEEERAVSLWPARKLAGPVVDGRGILVPPDTANDFSEPYAPKRLTLEPDDLEYLQGFEQPMRDYN